MQCNYWACMVHTKLHIPGTIKYAYALAHEIALAYFDQKKYTFMAKIDSFIDFYVNQLFSANAIT